VRLTYRDKLETCGQPSLLTERAHYNRKGDRSYESTQRRKSPTLEATNGNKQPLISFQYMSTSSLATSISPAIPMKQSSVISHGKDSRSSKRHIPPLGHHEQRVSKKKQSSLNTTCISSSTKIHSDSSNGENTVPPPNSGIQMKSNEVLTTKTKYSRVPSDVVWRRRLDGTASIHKVIRYQSQSSITKKLISSSPLRTIR